MRLNEDAVDLLKINDTGCVGTAASGVHTSFSESLGFEAGAFACLGCVGARFTRRLPLRASWSESVASALSGSARPGDFRHPPTFPLVHHRNCHPHRTRSESPFFCSRGNRIEVSRKLVSLGHNLILIRCYIGAESLRGYVPCTE